MNIFLSTSCLAGHAHVAEALGVPLHIFFTMPWTWVLTSSFLASFWYRKNTVYKLNVLWQIVKHKSWIIFRWVFALKKNKKVSPVCFPMIGTAHFLGSLLGIIHAKDQPNRKLFSHLIAMKVILVLADRLFEKFRWPNSYRFGEFLHGWCLRSDPSNRPF